MDYPQKPGVLRGAQLEIGPGEIVGLVGESGSGKSTLALAVLGLLKHTGAAIRGHNVLLGEDRAGVSEREWRSLRGRVVSLVPQSPVSALNPALRIGTHLREAWKAHSNVPWSTSLARVTTLLELTGLPETLLNRFPQQISVGQAQRVLIVTALLHGPALLIADEPTASLDVITQREILGLLRRLSQEENLSMLLISHDLLVVASLCSKVCILHDGRIVESGCIDQVLSNPQHPYTARLLAAMPVDARLTRSRSD